MNNLLKNRKKGFTLVELIVVIVIIAVLIAALTPAILGVIRRANHSADEADLRTMMMAGSVAALMPNATSPPAASAIHGQISGRVGQGTYRIYFDGPVAIAGTIIGGRYSDTAPITIGTVPPTLEGNLSVRQVGVQANGALAP